MNYDNVMNVIRVNQMGSISIDDSTDGLSWNSPFSVVMQVKYLLPPDYSILFKKDGFLKLEVMDGYLAISGTGIPDTVVSFSIDGSSMDEFHLFAVTYNSSILRIFHNYSLIQVLSVERNTLVLSTEPIIVGDCFEGYISYFRVFDYALSIYEISEQSNLMSVSEQNYALVELTAITGIIECKKRMISVLECVACNLIPCFSFKRYGNIRLYDDISVNPAGIVEADDSDAVLSVKPYTIVTEILFIPSNQQQYCIFSNGSDSADSGMALYIERSDNGNHYLCAKLGRNSQNERIIRSSAPILEGRWIRIANSYHDGVLKLIVDQQEVEIQNVVIDGMVSEQVGKCTIGDFCDHSELLDERNFSGYIKYVFVFDEALQDENCLVENLSDVYSLVSLVGAYEAQSVQEKNQVGAADIYMSRGVTSLLLENSYGCLNLQQIRSEKSNKPYLDRDSFGVKVWTVRDSGKVIFKYLSPEGREIVIDSIDDIGLSDETVWYIEGLLIVIIGVVTIITGLKVSTSGKTKIVANLINLINNPYMRTALQLLCRNVSWPNILNLFRVIYQTGFLKKIILCLFELSWYNVLSVILHIISVICGVAMIDMGILIAVLVAATLEWIEKKPGNPEKNSIKLSKVIFLHKDENGCVDPSKSAVYLQKEYNMPEPEYDHNNPSRNNVLYISSCINCGVTIKAEFVVTGNESYVVQAESNSSRHTLDTRAEVISQTECSKHFSLPWFTFDEGILERSEITLVWKAKNAEGNWFTVAESKHRLYFLPSIPSNPIEITKHDKDASPFTSLLDIYFDYIKEKTDDESDVKTKVVKALYNYRVFKYMSEPSYAIRYGPNDGYTMCLQMDLLIEDLVKKRDGGTIFVNCADISTIMYYMMCVMDSVDSVTILGIFGSFTCYGIQLIGNTESVTQNFGYHYVIADYCDVGSNEKERFRIYDPCLMYQRMLKVEDRCGDMMWGIEGVLSHPVEVMLGMDEKVPETSAVDADYIGSYLRNLQQLGATVDLSGVIIYTCGRFTFENDG